MLIPELPGWDGLHSFAAHFPIALLPVAPLLIVVGLFAKRSGPPYLITALILMVLGTIGASAAALTGQEAAEIVHYAPHVWPIRQRHEELAEVATALFAALTLVFALLVFIPLWLERRGFRMRRTHFVGMHVTYMLFYLATCLVLMHAGHEGGRLVYEFGVRAGAETEKSRPTTTSAGEPRPGLVDDQPD